jgi:hypothetical protein
MEQNDSVPKLLVFVKDKKATELQELLLKKLVALDYAPMVDAVHTKSYEWFVKNVTSCSHKLFSLEEDDVFFYEVDELDPAMRFVPDVLVYFNEGESVSVAQWVAIRYWFRFILFENEMETDFVLQGKELMKTPYKEKAVIKKEDDCVWMERTQEQKYYSFRKQLITDDDIMVYEIIKPFTDLPYTAVIRNYSLRGDVPFFTSLYICPSWGVSRYDLPFLKHLWKEEFGFDESLFDMDRMLKEATEACYPQPGEVPEPEPEVYRRSLEDVKETLQDRKEGRICGFHKDHGVPREIRDQIKARNAQAEEEVLNK